MMVYGLALCVSGDIGPWAYNLSESLCLSERYIKVVGI